METASRYAPDSATSTAVEFGGACASQADRSNGAVAIVNSTGGKETAAVTSFSRPYRARIFARARIA